MNKEEVKGQTSVYLILDVSPAGKRWRNPRGSV